MAKAKILKKELGEEETTGKTDEEITDEPQSETKMVIPKEVEIASKKDKCKVKIFTLKGIESITVDGVEYKEWDLHERLVEILKEKGFGKYIGEKYV